MKLAVLGASGQTGRLVVEQALARGHDVVALVRDPAKLPARAAALRVARADVTDPDSVLTATRGVDAIVSGLGVHKGQDAQVLVQGARVAAATGVRVVWLGTLGTGVTEGTLGRLTGVLLSKAVLKYEWTEKPLADEVVRVVGGTVVHAGPLVNRDRYGAPRLVPTDGFKRRLPPTAPRAGIATLMLDEAERPRYTGRTAVALFGSR